MSTDRPDLPDPATAPQLFEGLLTRRAIAHVIDLVILGAIVFAVLIVFGIGGILTLGLGWLLLPIALPFAILAYYAVTLGGPNRATVGMAMTDIVLTPIRAPLDGFAILIHPIVFWVTIWVCWPFSLAFALFTPRRQMLHDLVTGTLMVRRSPMQRHWSAVGA